MQNRGASDPQIAVLNPAVHAVAYRPIGSTDTSHDVDGERVDRVPPGLRSDQAFDPGKVFDAQAASVRAEQVCRRVMKLPLRFGPTEVRSVQHVADIGGLQLGEHTILRTAPIGRWYAEEVELVFQVGAHLVRLCLVGQRGPDLAESTDDQLVVGHVFDA